MCNFEGQDIDMPCSIADCKEAVYPRYWQGKYYCITHYNELMSNAFEKEWSCWEENMPPSPWLRSFFGRFLEEKWSVRNGLMSKARIRDRAFNFLKGGTGFTFEITRHPGAFMDWSPYGISRIVQKWEVSLKDAIVELIEERPWTTDDPD